MMSGKDLGRLFKRIHRREKMQVTLKKLKSVDAKIVPVSAAPNDAQGECALRMDTSSPVMMPPPKVKVSESKDSSIIYKKLGDIPMDRFSVKSCLRVRFRKRDNKVFSGDLLVQMGMFKTLVQANAFVMKMLKDGMLKDLKSLQCDMRFLAITDQKQILMSLPDALELLERHDLRTIVKDIIVPQMDMAGATHAVQDMNMTQTGSDSASDLVQDDIIPPIAILSASDAMQDVVMLPITILSALDAVDDIIVPPIGFVSACEAVDDVIVPPIGGVSACEAVVDVIVPPIGGLSACEAVVDVIVPPTAASGAVKNVTVPPTVMAVVSGTARPVAVKIRMRKVPASVLKTISGFENLLDSSLEGKEVRQVEPGQVDEEGQDIGGKWVISDGVSACTGDKAEVCLRWVKNPKNVNKDMAKSLTYIDSGHSFVSLSKLTKYRNSIPLVNPSVGTRIITNSYWY